MLRRGRSWLRRLSKATRREVVIVFNQKSDSGGRTENDGRFAGIFLTCSLYTACGAILLLHVVLLAAAYRSAVEGGSGVVPLPGVGSAIPATITDGAVLLGCLVVSIAAHELGHVLAYRRYAGSVRSVGVDLVGVIPVRFFTRYNRQTWKRLPPGSRARVLSAGLTVNFLFAAVSWAVFTRFEYRLVGYLSLANVALTVITAVPLTGTDGDRLFAYLLTGALRTTDAGDTSRVQLLAGMSSWLVVVGSILTVVISLVVVRSGP